MFGAGIKLMDDEDDFFGNLDNSRTNLADLFDNPQSKVKVDQSLKYTPQKPKHASLLESKSDKVAKWNIEIAKVVTAFKLVDQDNSPQGKLGFALLKSPEGLQKIILYRTKNNILSTKTLTDDVKLLIKKSYLQYTDDLQVFWSILFENEDESAVLSLIKDFISEEKSSSPIQSEPAVVENQVASSSFTKHIDKSNSSDEKQNSVKQNILTRISKMGQALPTLNQPQYITTDLSDSSDTEVKKIVPVNKPSILTRKPTKPQQQIKTMVTSTTTPATQIISPAGIFPIQYSNVHQDSQYINMLLTENRAQNTEVRINISKLETKIEKVLDKIDLMQRMNSNNGSTNNLTKVFEDEILNLEEKVLSLKKENRNLKEQMNEMNFETNKTSNSLHLDDFKGFEDIIETLNLDIKNYDNSVKLFQEITRLLFAERVQLKTSLETHEIEQNELKLKFAKLEKTKNGQKTDLDQQIEDLKLNINSSEATIETLTEEKKKLLDDLGNIDQTVENRVKNIMNNLYQNIVMHFHNDENKQFSSEEVLKMCGIEIRNQTRNEFYVRKHDN